MEAEKDRTTREVTRLLRRVSRGDATALEQLVPIVYEELRARAARSLRREPPGHTLQSTALVHETYLRLIRQEATEWMDRAHFFAVAATCMRRVLLDHARRRKADKRGGANSPLPLEEAASEMTDAPWCFLTLNDALEGLSAFAPRQGRVAELRLFCGLPLLDIARAMEVSLRTVENEWRHARAWLAREMAS